MAGRLGSRVTAGEQLAGAAVELARRQRTRLPDDLALLAWSPGVVEVPDGAGPDYLGTLHEQLLGRGERRARGAFYTPADVAARLVSWVVDGLRHPVVLDPACGGGVFLLEAARHTDRLVAIDVDPLAVAVTEASVFLATGRRPTTVVADALLHDWPAADVVVGNPPFLGQLGADTARRRERADALEARWGTAARGYVDDAALFLLAAGRHAPRVALLQPESVVATRDAAAVRRELAPAVASIWLPDRPLFDAAVRVIAVLLDRDSAPAVADDRWSELLADAGGVPRVVLESEGTLGAHAVVTAGFRDEYYGLAPHVREASDGAAPLITSGLIDPGVCRWGTRPARFGRRLWRAPAVDAAALDGSPLAAWAKRQLVPKVLVATQTRVIEAVADEAGAWLPCTPVITVVPTTLDIWHVLAALLAPPVSAWAMRRTAGAALSAGAVKLSASQLRALPLPRHRDEWDDAAADLRSGDVTGAAPAACRAYGVDPVDVLGWWAARLPSSV